MTFQQMLSNVTDEQLEKMVSRLYDFYKNVVCLDYDDFNDAEHIQKLANELESLCRGDYDNLCVAMPPRHSKSSMVTLALPLWLIFNNPNLKILIVNAEASLSEKFGMDLRDFIQDFSPLTGIYLSEDKHSSTFIKFEDVTGHNYLGSIKLVGASGGITGQDADYLIIDDPYKGFEDITVGLLTKKIDWFKTKILQRKEPHTKLIICHTRWHTNDLQGYLKENNSDTYKFIEFSAIKDDGSSLWPERYSIDFLKQQLQDMGERLFSSIYQQKPLDESGDFFNLDNAIFLDTFQFDNPLITGKCRSWDLAYSSDEPGKDNDYTASCKMYRLLDDTYYVTDVTMERYGDNILKELKSYARMDTPNVHILIETGTKGGAAKELYNQYKKHFKGYLTEQSEPVGSKVDRANDFKYALMDGKIRFVLNDNQRELLLKQLKGFPLAKHDDLVDALAYAYNYLNNHGESVVRTASKRKRETL